MRKGGTHANVVARVLTALARGTACAGRRFSRTPGFAAVVVLTLAPAIALLRLGIWPFTIAAAQDHRDVPTFTSNVDLVTVDAIVQDARAGRFAGSPPTTSRCSRTASRRRSRASRRSTSAMPRSPPFAAQGRGPGGDERGAEGRRRQHLRPAGRRRGPGTGSRASRAHGGLALPRVGPSRRRRADLCHDERRLVVERAHARGPGRHSRGRGSDAGAKPARLGQRLTQRVGGLSDRAFRRQGRRGHGHRRARPCLGSCRACPRPP